MNKNPRTENLKPFKPGQSGNPKGRPRIPDEVKAERKEAREILKEAAPHMAKRIAELANHQDPDISIKACKVGLDKILPNLEEVETHNDHPLPGFTDEQLERKLRELESRNNRHSKGNGMAA